MFFVLGEVFEHFGNLDKGAELLVALNKQAKLHVLGIFRIVLPGHSKKNPQVFNQTIHNQLIARRQLTPSTAQFFYLAALKKLNKKIY